MDPLGSAPPQRLGGAQQAARWRVWARRVVALLLFLAVTAAFAAAACSARRSARDLAFVLACYFLLALLVCCVAKLEQLRRHHDDPTAVAVAAERQRVRFGVWAVSVALANTFASRVAGEMPGLALKLVVWGVTVVVLGIGYYSIFRGSYADRCIAGHGFVLGDNVGRRREHQAPYEMYPEGRV